MLVDTAELENSSYEKVAKGDFSMPVMMGFLFRVLFGPPEYGARFTKTDNELLGIKEKTEADVEALFKSIARNPK